MENQTDKPLPAIKQTEQEWIDTMFLVGNKLYEIRKAESYFREKLETLQKELETLMKQSEKINARALYLKEQQTAEEKPHGKEAGSSNPVGSEPSNEPPQPEVSSGENLPS